MYVCAAHENQCVRVSCLSLDRNVLEQNVAQATVPVALPHADAPIAFSDGYVGKMHVPHLKGVRICKNLVGWLCCA